MNDGGSDSPGPIVKIPGVYERGQSGTTPSKRTYIRGVNANFLQDVYFSAYDLNFNITTFVPPAPVVWEG